DDLHFLIVPEDAHGAFDTLLLTDLSSLLLQLRLRFFATTNQHMTSLVLCDDSCFDLLANLIELRAMRLLTIRESAHHLMIKPRNNVNMHVEHFLRSSSTI